MIDFKGYTLTSANAKPYWCATSSFFKIILCQIKGVTLHFKDTDAVGFEV